MNKTQVKQMILETIKKMGWATFPQLLRFLTVEGVNIHGQYQLEMQDKNIVLWGELSEPVVIALTELLSEQKIVGMPAPVEVYQINEVPKVHPLTLFIPEKALPHPAIFLTILRYVPQPTDAPNNKY